MREPDGKIVDGTIVQLALREMHAELTSWRTYAVLALVFAVLVVTGPFGTFERFDPVARAAYWGVLVVTGFGLGDLVATLVKTALARRGWSRLRRMPIVGSLGGAAGALPSLVLNAALSGDRAIDPAAFGNLLVYGMVMGLAISAIVLVVTPEEKAAPKAVPEEGSAAPGMPRLLRRLPIEKRGALVSLSMNDHYVLVVTEAGRDLVLLRLADAMAEAEPVGGIQIHRSHWVALAAIRTIHRSGRRLEVETSLGERLPVSRSFVDAVRGAGLLPG